MTHRHARLAIAFCFLIAPPVSLFMSQAQADHADCSAIQNSISQAGFSGRVDVVCEDGFAIIVSDTYPDHELMTGIVGTNEQIAVPAEYAAPIILSPELAESPQTRDAALGVAVNGVPIYDYTAGGEMTLQDLHHHQTRHDTLLTKQLDVCGGHAGRGDDYHYHVKPTCMIDQMKNAGDNAIIGWAFDGFPIFGDNNPDGTKIGDNILDVCNGQPDPTYGYRYHTSADAPYIIQCLMGRVDDVKKLPRVRPLKAAGGGSSQPSGKPPRGGVEDLIFTESDNGKRRMQYAYQGELYFIEYVNSVNPGCFDFVTRTITNRGELMQGEYCRD